MQLFLQKYFSHSTDSVDSIEFMVVSSMVHGGEFNGAVSPLSLCVA